MSVTNHGKIDAMGKNPDPAKRELTLCIMDHLDWEEEYEHLCTLQEKINGYIGFIDTKQFSETYPQDEFDSYVIMIYFMHGMSENCLKFLDVVANQVKELNISIAVDLGDDEE